VLSGGWDGTLNVLDATDGRVLHSHALPNKHILDIDPFSDGVRVLVGCQEGDLLILDQVTGSVLNEFQDQGPSVDSVACSSHGTHVAAGMIGGEARIWEIASGQSLHSLHHGDDVRGIIFSPDDRLLVTSGADNMVRIWDVVTGAERAALRGHTNWVSDVVFSPVGHILASAGQDRTVRLWRAPIPDGLP
jgi:WD40 repeat protein